MKLGLTDIIGGPYGSVVVAPDGMVRVYASGQGWMHVWDGDLQSFADYGTVLPGGYEGSVFYDPSTKKYRALYSIRGVGPCTAVSGDGMQWSDWQGPWIQRACDSPCNARFDEESGKYEVYLRAWRWTPDGKWYRIVVRAELDQLEDLAKFKPCEAEPRGTPFRDGAELLPLKAPVAWPFEVVADIPGPNADWYTWPVSKINGRWYAFPSLYTHDPGDRHTLSEGTTEILLAKSDNGYGWWTNEGAPYIARGTPEEPDCGCLYAYSGHVMLPGRKVWQLYYGNNRTHTHHRVLSSNRTDFTGGIFAVETDMERLER